MNLDVESLRTFLAVLDHGGMTAASDHLDLSQSAVSWKIKRLEERVGKPLLVRDGRSLRASTDGLALVDDARTIVDIHDRAVTRLRGSELSGTVRLGSNQEIGTDRLTLVLGRFKRTHPATSIAFELQSTDQLVAALDGGELDVVLIQVDDDGHRPTDTVLWSDELVWATCCESPYDEGLVPLITFGQFCFYRPLSEPMLRQNKIDYTIAFSGPSATGVNSAVAAGLGVAVIGSRGSGATSSSGNGVGSSVRCPVCTRSPGRFPRARTRPRMPWSPLSRPNWSRSGPRNRVIRSKALIYFQYSKMWLLRSAR